MKYRIVTADGKEIARYDTYRACESFWDDFNGYYEDENGNGFYIYIEEITE